MELVLLNGMGPENSFQHENRGQGLKVVVTVNECLGGSMTLSKHVIYNLKGFWELTYRSRQHKALKKRAEHPQILFLCLLIFHLH